MCKSWIQSMRCWASSVARYQVLITSQLWLLWHFRGHRIYLKSKFGLRGLGTMCLWYLSLKIHGAHQTTASESLKKSLWVSAAMLKLKALLKSLPEHPYFSHPNGRLLMLPVCPDWQQSQHSSRKDHRLICVLSMWSNWDSLERSCTAWLFRRADKHLKNTLWKWVWFSLETQSRLPLKTSTGYHEQAVHNKSSPKLGLSLLLQSSAD